MTAARPISVEFARAYVAKYEPRVLRLVPDGCWTIPGFKLGPGGYLRLSGYRTHRVFFVAANGPLDEDMEPDHLCRNRACCNPEHMEATSHEINTLRGIGPPARNARKTHCRNQHPLSGDNLRLRLNKDERLVRACRACAIEKSRRGRKKRAERGNAPKRLRNRRPYMREYRKQKKAMRGALLAILRTRAGETR